ncbi:MAG: response regulator [Thermoplasmatota archaeon]
MARILVVDDNEDILESTASLLQLRGHAVETLLRAGEVLDALRRDPPDILLQDCHMPGLDLPALLRSIRAQPRLRSLPILLFTASTDAAELWRTLGADGLIWKPFEAAELQRAIDKCLASRHAAVQH